jgi:long-chain acyl-CoA synthetase
MDLLRRIQRQLILRPLHDFVVDDQRTWKGATLLVAAWHMARAIERSTERDTVGLLLPTGGLFPAALLATWMTGKVAVPLNYLLSREDLEYIVQDAGLETVVTVQPMLDYIHGPTASMCPLKLEDVGFGGLPPVRRSARRDPDDLAVLLYTSGTSGRPKGVMLSAGNLASNVEQIRQWAHFDHRDVLLGVLPQFHAFGLTVLTLLPLALGARAIYTARFQPRKVLDLAHQHRVTAFVAIPSMYNALVAARHGGPECFAGLRYAVSGAEPLPDAVAQAFQGRFGVRIAEGYGLTETSPVSNWCLPEDWRHRSVGRALPGIQQRIVGEDGRVLPAGRDGEVRMKGPNVMHGYWNLPEETARAFDEHGFFRTGDMGRLDADGHLSITGRIKEMLIIAGENVFPREIEEVLQREPGVKAAAVVGMQDPVRGEVPLAFVEMHEGAAFDQTRLQHHCRTVLPPYKVPREIRRRDELPRNPTGKIIRRQLGDEVPHQP